MEILKWLQSFVSSLYNLHHFKFEKSYFSIKVGQVENSWILYIKPVDRRSEHRTILLNELDSNELKTKKERTSILDNHSVKVIYGL